MLSFLPPRRVQKRQRPQAHPSMGPCPPRAGDTAGAGGASGTSLTLSDSITGQGDTVIITGSLLRALGSHAFSVDIFT